MGFISAFLTVMATIIQSFFQVALAIVVGIADIVIGFIQVIVAIFVGILEFLADGLDNRNRN